MALLNLDFAVALDDQMQFLVKQIIQQTIGNLFGVEPLSTTVDLFKSEDSSKSEARVKFFLLSSSRDSLNLRKQLIEMAKDSIHQRLASHNLDVLMQDPILYVDSPVTR
jgi:MscS family membrane protein